MPSATAPPVTLVLGDEELLAEREVAARVRAAEDAFGAGTTVEQVEGGALPAGFAMELATASLFGGGRVIVIRDAEDLDASTRASVLAAARDPAPGTILVVRAAGMGRQGKFFRELQASADVVLVPKLKPSERSRWVQAELRRMGRRAAPAVVPLLIDMVGGELRDLAGALAKLDVAVPPPAVLSAEDLRRHLSQTAERGIFELTDAVLAREPAKALGLVDALITQGEDPLGLLGMLARQLRIVLRVHELAGAPASRVAAEIGGGLRDWQVDRARRQAARFAADDLRRGLGLVADADTGIRNGGLPPRLAIELLVGQLSGAVPLTEAAATQAG